MYGFIDVFSAFACSAKSTIHTFFMYGDPKWIIFDTFNVAFTVSNSTQIVS